MNNKMKGQLDQDKIFFISDTHFSHYNIMKYSDRPFKDTNEMDETMIKNWNNIVPKDGIVFHLGDFAWKEVSKWKDIRSQLNGSIHLIYGNHDERLLKQIKDLFEEVTNYKEINVIDVDSIYQNGLQNIILFHYPIRSWNRQFHGSWSLSGHCHPKEQRADEHEAWMDVGVDANNFTPVTYQQVKDFCAPRYAKFREKFHDR